MNLSLFSVCFGLSVCFAVFLSKDNCLKRVFKYEERV